jgi:membrane-associated protein
VNGVHHLAFNPLASAGPVMVWVVVLCFVFTECAFIIGLFLPGDSLLLTAGVVLAAHDVEGHAWALALVATVVAIAGNQLGYYIGKTTGTKLLARSGGKVLTRESLARAEKFLNRNGWWAILLARWIPWIRTLAPMVAGAAGMNARRYLVASSLGALMWVPSLVLIGYYGAGFLDTIPWIRHLFTWGMIIFLLAGTGYGLYRYRQEMHRPVVTTRVE